MGTVFKKRSTRALPAGATITTKGGRRVARWTAKGKAKTAEYVEGNDGAGRIVTESRTYFAKYRDGGGIVRVVATGCRDEASARQRLAELERTAERVRARISTTGEERAAGLLGTALAEHFDAYLTGLEAAGVTKGHRENVRRFLDRVCAECYFARLADLDRGPVEEWLVRKARANTMGARTRNAYRDALIAFGKWAKETHRLNANPFAGLPRADAKADPRRARRALTPEELARLLDVTARRPLDDARTIRRGENKGQTSADLRPENVQRLERIGRERALIYKTLILTGLRKNELATLTVGQLDLDTDPAYLTLDAADEKNRQGNALPIRADLAADLRAWLALRLDEAREEAQRAGKPIPLHPDASSPLFDVPAGLLRILDRDLRAAGIAKRDDRGRVVDVHAMRMTFGTLLAKGGVSPRTAQAALRHSDPRLTANVYTDPRLLDVLGALDVMPALTLTPGYDTQRATGTAGRTVAPTVAPTRREPVQFRSATVRMAGDSEGTIEGRVIEAMSNGDKRKELLTTQFRGFKDSGRQDLNLRPLGPEPSGDSSPGDTAQALTTTDPNGCTNGCTGEPETGTVEALAAALFALSDADRQRLAALLAGQAKGEDAR